MKQKIIILTAILLFSRGISIQAQQTNASAGGNATGSGGTVSYTIGQQEYSNFSSGGGSVNQGVQQPKEFFGTNCTPTTSTTNISICPTALPYSWNGLTFNTAGSQTKHLTNTAGCDSAATLNLSITAQPTPPVNNVCVGSTLQLTNAITGGVWASVAGRASVSNTGLVTGNSLGEAIIQYTLPNKIKTIYNITVNPLPATPTIGYKAPFSNPQAGAPYQGFCVGKVFGVLGSPACGVWSTTGCISVTSGGIATINTTGAGSLTYTYTDTKGCAISRTMTGAGYVCAARGTVNNQKQEIRNEFSIFPNPAKSYVTLNLETLVGEGQIIVSDLYGRVLKKLPLSMGNNNIDIANLSKGVYFISTITSEAKTTKKLVVE